MPTPERKSFLLRIDPKLWDELETWAEQELRSINGPVEYILRDAVKRRRRATAADQSSAASGDDSSGS